MNTQEEIQELRKQITELEFENARLKSGESNSNLTTPKELLTNAEKSQQAKERAEIFHNARIIGQD